VGDEIQSLTDLINRVSAKRFLDAAPREERDRMELTTFPFFALVGQKEMKLSLLLTLIHPGIGPALLIGPQGTGKSTAVRGLADLMPEVPHSRCEFGCTREDVEMGGVDSVCPACAKRFAQGEPQTIMGRVRVLELPLNARVEDVCGYLKDQDALHRRMRLKMGLLGRAHRNLLYLPEVNHLKAAIVDAALEAAREGKITLHQRGTALTYPTKFTLIGSMDPASGPLRPRVLDRFGLRAFVVGLKKREDRQEAVRRTLSYRSNPRRLFKDYDESTLFAREELALARNSLPDVVLSPEAKALGLALIQALGIDSLRAEITLFEAARAHAIADNRPEASPSDIKTVAPLALRMRRPSQARNVYHSKKREDEEIINWLDEWEFTADSQGGKC
jgi:magnesium chelatase subunit I